MEITYGLNTESHEDRFLQAAERGMNYSQSVLVPGAFLVDTFPIRSFRLRFTSPPIDDTHKVKYVPEWFPGTGFKRFAKEARALFDIAVDGPLEYVKESLKVGFCGFFVLALIVPASPMAATLPSRRRAAESRVRRERHSNGDRNGIYR